MASPLDTLEPRILWEQFDAIRQIPRPSKQEERIAAYITEFAAKHGFTCDRDQAGNLVVRVPATKGHETAPVIVLQGHLDMVCEKNSDVDFDFDNDPIDVYVDGDLVKARGTTLGADNGLGIAAGLAVAIDPTAVHGPLELLFTVDEETGLTGAAELDGSLVKGRQMLNLDTEEDGAVYVGCAGGATTNTVIPITRVDVQPGSAPVRLRVVGLRGGHSGVDIHENRANAIRLLVRTIRALFRAGFTFDIVSLSGGSKHNAIPREAEALLRVARADLPKMETLVAKGEETYRAEFGAIDPNVHLVLEPRDEAVETQRPLSPNAAGRVRRALAACPHGVLAMSREVPGLVETSNNLAVVSTEEDTVSVTTSTRSSVPEALQATLDQVRAVFQLADGKPAESDAYPAWKPNLTSPILGTTKEAFKELFGHEPEIKAIHAGLECGILGEKVPGIDMVSFGPQIENAHSPDECCRISTVGRFYELLKAVLTKVA